MFERAYVLQSISWTRREHMTDEINKLVAAYDHPNAAASIACMTSDRDQIHILIEYWRVTDAPEEVDRGREGELDGSTAKRRTRRARASAADDVRAAERGQQEVVSEPVGAARGAGSYVSADDRKSAGEAPRRLKEEDVPLPFEAPAAGYIAEPFIVHSFTCGIRKSNMAIDCTCGKRAGQDKKDDPGAAAAEPPIEWP